MDRNGISVYLSLSLMLFLVSCSGKNISSSSGDASSQGGQSKSVEIQEDAIKTVPLDRSFDRPSGSATTLSSSNALGDVFFDYDRFHIRKDATSVLDTNAQWLRANGSTTVLIEGHCDERGTLAYNLVLGEKRARAAKKYLHDLGVPASQLQITSYGEARPFCKQQSEDCYQQNRRAHFVMK